MNSPDKDDGPAERAARAQQAGKGRCNTRFSREVRFRRQIFSSRTRRCLGAGIVAWSLANPFRVSELQKEELADRARETHVTARRLPILRAVNS